MTTVIKTALSIMKAHEYYVDEKLFVFLRRASSSKVNCSITAPLEYVIGVYPSLFLCKLIKNIYHRPNNVKVPVFHVNLWNFGSNSIDPFLERKERKGTNKMSERRQTAIAMVDFLKRQFISVDRDVESYQKCISRNSVLVLYGRMLFLIWFHTSFVFVLL